MTMLMLPKLYDTAKAALDGEAFDKDQIDPLWNHLGTTSLPLGWVDPPDELRSDVTVLL